MIFFDDIPSKFKIPSNCFMAIDLRLLINKKLCIVRHSLAIDFITYRILDQQKKSGVE